MSVRLIRPGFHVTAPTGWLNDPLGVTWHDGTYELFVQYNPEGTDWVPACHWGRFSSPDLVCWEWAGIALSPRPEREAGCWSGSVAVDENGVPVIVYTSVPEENLALGRVALAAGDPGWRHWTPDEGAPVLPGPPSEAGLLHFRDPYVWRADDGWRMAIGGGDGNRVALALQYSSPDLRSWSLDGVLAQRPESDGEPLSTGAVWECVQLFPLEGRWVLMVSVWADDEPQRMAAAVGAYDGRAFTAATWQRFTATDTLYAATTFLDADGRRCAISWAREPGTAGDGWAGLLALPVVLSLDGDRLVPAPHRAVDSLRRTRVAGWGETPLTAEPVRLGPVPPFLDLDLAVAEGRVRIGVVTEDAEVMALVIDADAGVVLVSRPGADDERIPLGRDTAGDIPVRLLLDAGLAEIFTAVDAGAVRAAAGEGAVSLVMTAPDGTARLRRLALFDMPSG